MDNFYDKTYIDASFGEIVDMIEDDERVVAEGFVGLNARLDALDSSGVLPGTQGFMGTQGYEGTQGAIGTQGLQGEQGTQGERGAQGYPGPVDLEGYVASPNITSMVYISQSDYDQLGTKDASCLYIVMN